MKSDEAWNNFLKTGTINEYLSYCAKKTDQTEERGNGNEVTDRGLDHQGNQYR